MGTDTDTPRVIEKIIYKESSTYEKTIKAIQTVGFPIVVAAFLLWEWHTVVRDLESTMGEVKLLLQDVRKELILKKTP